MSVEAYKHICQLFEKNFGGKPDITSVAPGRVNLIGEHVDHQGYAVLPTALGLTIQVAITKKPYNGKLMVIKHPNPSFTTREIATIDDLKLSTDKHWTNYVLAALYGLCEYEESGHDVSKVGSPASLLKGLKENEFAKKSLTPYSYQIMVDGRVPVAAGVSSSAALVVASASAFMKIFQLQMTRLALADMCANCERHVGVASGGMDQASICLSKPGGAQLIEFGPLKATTVFLPKNAALVVCNTCFESAKMETAAIYYNKRVFELKLACYMIHNAAFPNEKIPAHQIPSLTLKKIQEKCNVSLKEAHKLVEKHIPNRAVSKSTVIRIIGKEGVEALNNSTIGPEVWKRNAYFDPYRRAIHVFHEANRVYDFVATCADESMDEEAKMKELGRLMIASDESLTVDFDCSCPELYDVTSLALSLGAYGSRLTGAGWGGCAVSLVNKGNLTKFMEGMKAYFDQAAHPKCKFPKVLDDVLFPVIPGAGATLYGCDGSVIAWE